MRQALKALLAGIALALPLCLTTAAGHAQDYQTSRYQDWTVRCQPREGLPACDMYQTLIDQGSGDQVMQVSLAYSPDLQKYAFQAIVPFGFLIQPGVLIRVDEKQDFSEMKVTRCEKEACFVEGVPSEEMIQAFSAGVSGQVIMLNKEGKAFALPVSLKGFSSALKELLSKA